MSKNTNKKTDIRTLAECAIMLALSVVLSFISVYKLPYGGEITLFSQLPIVIISYRHGLKWGCITGFCDGILQMIFGFNNFSYVTGLVAVLILLFSDYLIPFTCLGLGGMFRKVIKNQGAAIAVGAVMVSVIRFLCHFISGVTIWSGYAENMAVGLYSLIYNGSYMLPEAIMTALGGVLISLVLDFRTTNISARKRKTAVAAEADSDGDE